MTARRPKAHYDVALSLIAVGLPLVIVQPGVVYGPGDPSAMGNTLRLYLQRKLPMIPQQSAFAWGYVDDIAQGHLLALDKGKVGEDYIIAGPIYTLIDALKIAEGITGIPAPKMTASPGMMRAMAALAGVIEPLVHLPDPYTSEGLRISAGVTYIGSNAKARRELGYSPRRLEDGLKLTLPYEMEKLGIKAKK